MTTFAQIELSDFHHMDKLNILFVDHVSINGFYQKEGSPQKINFYLEFEVGEEKKLTLFDFSEKENMLFGFVMNEDPQKSGHDCPFFFIGIPQESVLIQSA